MQAVRRLTGPMVMVALAVIALAWSTPASADQTAMTCNLTITMSLKPGITASPGEGTLNTQGKGTLDCEGTVDGKSITGPGTVTARGFYRGDCVTGVAANGRLAMHLPTEDGTVSAEADFIAHNILVAGAFVVASKKIGDATGTFSAVPVEGDCVTQPITEAAGTASGLVFKKS